MLDGMDEDLELFVRQNRDVIMKLVQRYISLGKPLMLRSAIWDEFALFLEENGTQNLRESPLSRTIRATEEVAIDSQWIYFAVRPSVARWKYIRLNTDDLRLEEITVSKFLEFKERIINGHNEIFTLEIDLGPFNRGFPMLKESRSIGRGVEFLNRKLSSELFVELGKGDKRLLNFLSVHQCRGMQLMLNDRIQTVPNLRRALRAADEYLGAQSGRAGWKDVAERMEKLGFEPGWGKTVDIMRYTLRLLSDILEAPEPATLERFLGSIPMIFGIAIISPHGYFGQENVLGLPDTGGQVVYILDQTRALEKEMRRRLSNQGIDIEPQIVVVTRLIPDAGDTTCDQKFEHISRTANAHILRVPFRDDSGQVVKRWISRFEVWPYLERFSQEAEREVMSYFSCRPDLIIGNYSDGSLVASMMSGRLGVTQCNIAHALEKTKYLYSDLFWKDNEEKYHFSLQFTADLISMNTADFIITSTYQEIAGKHDSVGQYESYKAFTMPGLYRVVNGIDMFDPKFNIVSPGADQDVYFPHTLKEKRRADFHETLQEMVFGEAGLPDSRGALADKSKPVIFTMARFDRIKNIAGFVEWYANSQRLRDLANVLVIGGSIDPDKSGDDEEREQIQRMHDLMDEHALDGQLRWLGVHMEKKLAGELYRFIADHRGVFVQPALFEAFGLTVIEAMTSGLPTFATKYGGPLEIIENGVSGFHIDPNHGDEVTDILSGFLEKCREDKPYWSQISKASVDRVMSRYTWSLYAERMMTLSRVYGFWKYVTNLERDETRRYLEMLYGLQFRKLVEQTKFQS